MLTRAILICRHCFKGPRHDDPNYNHSLVDTSEATSNGWKLVQYVYPEAGHVMEHQWEDNGDGHFRGLRMMVQSGNDNCDTARFDDFCVCRSTTVQWCCGPGPFPSDASTPPPLSTPASTASPRPPTPGPNDGSKVESRKSKGGAAAAGFLLAVAGVSVLRTECA